MNGKKESKILNQLLATISELNASFERKDISQVVVDGLLKIFNMESAFFYSIYEKEGYVVLEAQSKGSNEKDKIPIGHGFIGWVAKTGEMLVLTDRIGKKDFEHFIATPVKGKNGLLGVIGGRKFGKQGFSTLDKEYITLFGSQVGAMMEIYIYYHRLKRSKEFRDTILYNITSGIIVLNAEWRVKTYNKSAITMLSDMESLKNQEIYAIFKDDFFINAVKDVFEKKKPIHNIEIKRKERYFNINIVPMNYEAVDQVDLLLIIDDITELKKVYEDKERATRLSYLGQFVAGVAHELRNPLTGINITLEMVKEDKQIGELNKKRIDIVLKEISNLEEMLTSLLEISKPMSLKLKPVKIIYFLESLIDEFKKIAKKRNIEIHFDFDKKDYETMIDEKKIKQALFNLFNNSLENMPDGGIFSLSITSKNNLLLIKVEDNGRGIPVDFIERIYDPFFTTRETGTGLGLYITKSIIDHHKGKIKAESDGKSWTKFFIELPLNKRGN